MKKIRWDILIPVGVFVFAINSAQAASYKVLADGVANGGIVQGRITFEGTPPTPKMLTVDEDVEACGGDRPSDELLVNKSGGIMNVVLSITEIASGKDWGFPEEFVYDQKQCTFIPRILLIKPKSKGVVLNSDTVGHNFHTVSKGIYNVNKKIAADTKMVVAANKLRRPGTIRAKCDIHSWMGGYWIVAETPYTVLSDEDGKFSITDIPPGTYKLKIWHETLGESEQQVVVKAKEATEINASLKL
ncbi:MAG: hypothetical protein DWQ09_12565 [Proteobacteria bacterium]|nr:MAG: hypothetical protein DWQ09_12565 [Pseudomonadota bacterium]